MVSFQECSRLRSELAHQDAISNARLGYYARRCETADFIVERLQDLLLDSVPWSSAMHLWREIDDLSTQKRELIRNNAVCVNRLRELRVENETIKEGIEKVGATR